MKQKERYIYVVGDFFAKYYGDRIPESSPGAPTEYTVNTYDRRVTNARYVWDPELPQVDNLNNMQPELLQEVVLHFAEDPAGYGKPFREDLRFPIIADIRLEGVVQERKRSYGTMRGTLYVKVHTAVEE